MAEYELNEPGLWLDGWPRPAATGHKYDRGFVAIFGAPSLTGATRLAASACSSAGAGLVSVVAAQRGDIYRTTLPADIMVTDSVPEKASVLLAGSGGLDEDHRHAITEHRNRIRVLDAGALPERDSFGHLNERCILTPHRGEFERVFGSVGSSKMEMAEAAIAAARECGAIVVLKSHHTWIAHPDGRVVMNRHTSPWLAKAGTGDVLAGIIAGIAAQADAQPGAKSMDLFQAACAAVWIHGEAGRRIGPGLVASDLDQELRSIFRTLLASGEMDSLTGDSSK